MTDGIQRKYALIINGDPREARHFENVDRAIQALRAEDPGYQISVASTKRPSGSVSEFVAPNSANLRKVISGWKQKMDGDDLLVVYVTGHGKEGKDGEGCAELPEGCLSNKVLAGWLNSVPYGKRFIAMDNCYSGGAVSLFSNEKTIVVTAGSPGDAVSCGNFSPFLWDENAPDLDGDKVVTIAERFRYALQKGQTLDFSNYSSTIRSFSLAGQSAATASFPKEILNISRAEQLKAELKKLKPDQLALVMFGADWCGPCKAYLPTFERLTKEYDGQFRMIHLSRPEDDDRAWPEFGINGVPGLAFMNARGGQLIIPHGLEGQPREFLQKVGMVPLSEEEKIEVLGNLPVIKQLKQDLRIVMKYPPEKAMGELEILEQAPYTLRPTIIEYLQDASKSTSPTIRANAAFGLGKLGGLDVLDGLLALRNDPDPRVRIEVTIAIASIVPPGPGGFASAPSFDFDAYLAREVKQLKRNPDPWLRQRAYDAELARIPELVSSPKGYRFNEKRTPIYLEMFKDPAVEVRLYGVLQALRGILHDSFNRKKEERIPFPEYPMMKKVVGQLRKDPPLVKKLQERLVQEFELFFMGILLDALAESGADADDVAQEWREKLERTRPELVDRLQGYWNWWYAKKKVGHYLGVSANNSIQHDSGLQYQPGVETFYGYRWNNWMEARANASLHWVGLASNDSKKELRAGGLGAFVLHRASPWGNTGIDPFLSLQAGYFRLLKSGSDGLGLAAGPGLQIPLSSRVLLEASILGSLDIPFEGKVRPGLRVPIGIAFDLNQ